MFWKGLVEVWNDETNCIKWFRSQIFAWHSHFWSCTYIEISNHLVCDWVIKFPFNFQLVQEHLIHYFDNTGIKDPNNLIVFYLWIHCHHHSFKRLSKTNLQLIIIVSIERAYQKIFIGSLRNVLKLHYRIGKWVWRQARYVELFLRSFAKPHIR